MHSAIRILEKAENALKGTPSTSTVQQNHMTRIYLPSHQYPESIKKKSPHIFAQISIKFQTKQTFHMFSLQKPRRDIWHATYKSDEKCFLGEKCVTAATNYICNHTPVYPHIAIFFATIRILYIEQAIAIFMIHLHMHQQTWESTVFN